MTADMDDRRRAVFLFSLASSYAETGDHEAALRSGRLPRPLFQAADAEREITSLHVTLATTYLGLGNTAHASELAGEARQRATAASDRSLRAHIAEETGRRSPSRLATRPARGTRSLNPRPGQGDEQPTLSERAPHPCPLAAPD